MSKRSRTLETFFTFPTAKKPRSDDMRVIPSTAVAIQASDNADSNVATSRHPTYPFPVPHLSADITELLSFTPAAEGQTINDQPELDLVLFQPYVPKNIERSLFQFLRRELFFYRVKYTIKRGSIETQINTPRFTTVFGVDETARFNDRGELVDATSKQPLPARSYSCRPRPIPACLDTLRKLTENATGCKFNFALVNYYASGNDSISYHSDDERFLGPDPAIASFSLGAKRDFLIRHKPTPSKHSSESSPRKFHLASGDMILMRGKTQSNWLHSIPKRKSGEANEGRINITFRKAMVKGGTENYYRYNVGEGAVYQWDVKEQEMLVWNIE